MKIESLPKIQNQTQMYEGSPWCLGRYESFEVNKPRLITLLNHDYVIWKDDNGNLNALDNICPHAGANLAKGGRIVKFKDKSCLACPYHGNKVQFLGDGKVIIEGNISSKDIQQVLPLQVINGLVWTYGLNWEEKNGKLISQPIEPKLPIPDYSQISFLPQFNPQLNLEELNHIYSFSQSFDGDILQMMWNVHDGEHFAGTHYNSMLTKEIKIENLTQNKNKISWQLFLYRQDDNSVNKNKISLFVKNVMVQCFNTFLPSLFILTNEISKDKLFVAVGYGYPESPTKTRFCVDGYLNFQYTWWHKLLKFPQKGNHFRDTLLFEDLNILNNLYPKFNKKIALKNDTPAQLAFDYLKNWNS